jgi:uncharacterized protein (TIGR03492 family)
MTILFISNGHGEDLNGSLIAQEIRQINPDLKLAALPIVGEGNSYRKLNIEIIVPTKNMPSGGIFYLNPLNFIKDLISGLVRLTFKQISAIYKYRKKFDLIIAVGDIVPILFAYISGRKFMAFIVSSSSYYEGKLKLPLLTAIMLKSPRCLKIFTRDQFTAEDLAKKGFHQVIFAGYPIMDTLKPSGKDLKLSVHLPIIALLPGSRLPEALHNLELELQVCEQLILFSETNFNFRAALVPNITNHELKLVAHNQDWEYLEPGILRKKVGNQEVIVRCYDDAFSDILTQCNLVLGMAGTAIEQAVGLGKPVVQIPGDGPQFTYRFAEAQMRLLGRNVTTINNSPSKKIMCQNAAQKIIDILADHSYLKQCLENGKQRVGGKGGSYRIAAEIIKG